MRPPCRTTTAGQGRERLGKSRVTKTAPQARLHPSKVLVPPISRSYIARMGAGSLFWGPALGLLPALLGTWMGGRGTRTTTVRVQVTVQYEEGEGEGWRGRGRGKKTLHYPVLCQASSRLRVFELVEPPSTSKEQREYLTGALVHMYACPWRNVTSAASWNWPVVQVTLQQMQCKADSRELVSN